MRGWNFVIVRTIEKQAIWGVSNAVMTDGTEKYVCLQLHRAKLAKYAKLDIPLGDLQSTCLSYRYININSMTT